MMPNKPTGETMIEGSTPAEETAETITAPISALGGAAVGDTVTLTVDSINGDTATLSMADSEESGEAPMGKGISEAAKLFNEGGE